MLSARKAGKQDGFIESDAQLSQKFSEAGFGRKDGDDLVFSPIEAAYIVNLKKTKFDKTTLEKFLSENQKKDKNFRFTFMVYAMVRGGGRILVPAGDTLHYFRVYAPGVGRPENRPSQLLRIMPGDKVSPKSIGEEIEIAHRERLELIVAVGTESAPKFYKISAFNF
jgi:tRNA splicing endonuclease